MTCLVVGNDKFGGEAVLRKRLGVRNVLHWDGRSKPRSAGLPQRVGLVLMYTGYVSHGLMKVVRRQAKARGIRVLFVTRGLSDLANQMEGAV